ncbi:MAG: hypothetical protein IJW31_02210 [Lentisphaeria bacterium]|nr:hypothetical protein [Lentisphaeria bacterium]
MCKDDEFNKLDKLIRSIDQSFNGKDILKKNTGLKQILRQTECDVIGCALSNNKISYYTLEIAYHSGNLNYGSSATTIAKVISKLMRTALVLYCYFGVKEADVIFASPKIGNSMINDLEISIKTLQNFFNNAEFGFKFQFKLYANENFKKEIMDNILKIQDDIADTSELFLRSIQLCQLFKKNNIENAKNNLESAEKESMDNANESKIAYYVKEELVSILQGNNFPEDTIKEFMELEYSKDIFGIHFPLLSKEKNIRYYANPIEIHGQKYYLCSQWYERNRQQLCSWIERNSGNDD